MTEDPKAEAFRNIVHEGKPEVTLTSHVFQCRCGEEVGSIEATYDFSKVPEPLHELGLQCLVRQTTRVHGDFHGHPDPPTPKLPWYKRLFS